MTRMPGTIWSPVANHSTGVVRPPDGMVVHTAVTPETIEAALGVVHYFDNPAAQVSSYFVVGIDGTIYQCVDLDDKAWTEAAGNRRWVGVENVGDGTRAPLTPEQVQANARILAWLHTEYGMPLQRTDDPINGRGLGWHGMGGAAWGGHSICPGSFVHAQLDDILAAAVALVNPTPVPTPTPAPITEGEMFLFQEKGSAAVNVAGTGSKGYSHVPSLDRLKEWQAILKLTNPGSPVAGAVIPVTAGFAADLAAGALGVSREEAVALLPPPGPAIVKTLPVDALAVHEGGEPIHVPEPYEGAVAA